MKERLQFEISVSNGKSKGSVFQDCNLFSWFEPIWTTDKLITKDVKNLVKHFLTKFLIHTLCLFSIYHPLLNWPLVRFVPLTSFRVCFATMHILYTAVMDADSNRYIDDVPDTISWPLTRKNTIVRRERSSSW